MTTTKHGAGTIAVGNHARNFDAVITHIDNHLERYAGSPMLIELTQVPTGMTQTEYQTWLNELVALYSTDPDGYAAWTVVPDERFGVQYLRFS